MSRTLKIWLLLTPALLVIVFLFLGGLMLGLARSFNYMPVIGLTDFNFDAYINVFNNYEFYQSVGLSLYIAVTATVLATGDQEQGGGAEDGNN
jgi:putative spermidine/putrescine transport system permease protein